jgi:hypothetical protein
LFFLASCNSFHPPRPKKRDENYLKKLEETTKDDKRRRRQAEATCEACERDLMEAKATQKVRDKTPHNTT